MTTAAKVILGSTSFGALITGGVVLMNSGMPSWQPLKLDSGFSTDSSNYGSTKFGKKYESYLVGMSEYNKSWWEWSFQKLKSDIENNKLSGSKWFKGDSDSSPTITGAYGTEEKKFLNKVCEQAYKSEDNNIGTEEDTSNNKFKKTEVFKYCSPYEVVESPQ